MFRINSLTHTIINNISKTIPRQPISSRPIQKHSFSTQSPQSTQTVSTSTALHVAAAAFLIGLKLGTEHEKQDTSKDVQVNEEYLSYLEKKSGLSLSDSTIEKTDKTTTIDRKSLNDLKYLAGEKSRTDC
ncbi:hypothetical protein HOG98_00930 [bacterium]|jgi:hypothetical protein|nr:hypothetical protein [bacterium]